MTFTNRQQKMMIGWILRICLVVILSNPSGVAAFNFPGFVSSEQGLRGAHKSNDSADEEEFLDSASLDESISSDESISLDEYPENESDEEVDENEEANKYASRENPEGEDWSEDENEEESEEEFLDMQEERELHGFHANNGGFGRSYSYSNTNPRRSNYNNGYYSGYNYNINYNNGGSPWASNTINNPYANAYANANAYAYAPQRYPTRRYSYSQQTYPRYYPSSNSAYGRGDLLSSNYYVSSFYV